MTNPLAASAPTGDAANAEPMGAKSDEAPLQMEEPLMRAEAPPRAPAKFVRQMSHRRGTIQGNQEIIGGDFAPLDAEVN
jgi:hypothetical protein